MRAILFLFLLAIPAIAQNTNDIRIVNGVRVNLSPVSSWFLLHDCERPMKHWKLIRITEAKGHLSNWFKCRITFDGSEKDVLLANAEKVESSLLTYSNLTAKIAATDQWIESAKVGLRRAEARAEAININTSAYAYVPQTAYNSIEDARDALARMRLERTKLGYEVGVETTDLAMFTGKKYGDLEIWDCGKKLSQ